MKSKSGILFLSLILLTGNMISAQIEPVSLKKFKSVDIGNPAIAGSTQITDNKINMTAGGADVWNKRDEFRFAYFLQSGDFDLVSKIESLTDPHLYTKAGLMVREDLSENSRHIFFMVFPDNKPRNKNNGGYEFQYRLEKAGESKAIYPAKFDGVPEFPVNYPETWIRLKRSGNEFTGFYSPDGKSWKPFASFTLELPEKTYLGLAVTSHNVKASAEAVFSSIGLLK
jgi:regulation of enolase protein 1 (concanavalin A-like superfamily)